MVDTQLPVPVFRYTKEFDLSQETGMWLIPTQSSLDHDHCWVISADNQCFEGRTQTRHHRGISLRLCDPY